MIIIKYELNHWQFSHHQFLCIWSSSENKRANYDGTLQKILSRVNLVLFLEETKLIAFMHSCKVNLTIDIVQWKSKPYGTLRILTSAYKNT